MAGPVTEAHRAFLAQRRFGSLDGLRCFAILGVILHHCWHGLPSIAVSTRGFLGVDLFFVLSGFLIVTLLLRERDHTGTIDLPAFYFRRSLRIFPVYYGLLAALTIVFTLRTGSSEGPAFLAALPYLVTYTANWATVGSFMVIAWSLAAEEQFYLIWPPIEKRLGGRRIVAVIVAIIAVNQVINFGLLDSALGELRSRNILQVTFTPILLGVLLAHLLHSRRGFRLLYRALGQRFTPVALVIALAMVVSLPAPLVGPMRLAIHLLMMALLATCVMRESHVLAPVFRFGPIARVGVVSYGMYLFHVVAQFFALAALRRYVGESSLVLFAVTTLATYLLAEVSFRVYETPFLSLKERLWMSPATKSLTVAPPITTRTAA